MFHHFSRFEVRFIVNRRESKPERKENQVGKKERGRREGNKKQKGKGRDDSTEKIEK